MSLQLLARPRIYSGSLQRSRREDSPTPPRFGLGGTYMWVLSSIPTQYLSRVADDRALRQAQRGTTSWSRLGLIATTSFCQDPGSVWWIGWSERNNSALYLNLVRYCSPGCACVYAYPGINNGIGGWCVLDNFFQMLEAPGVNLNLCITYLLFIDATHQLPQWI